MPLRIMQVVLSLAPGGLERVVVNLVNHASADFEFTVCCLEEAGEFGPLITRPATPIVALGKRPGLDWRLPWRIARLVRREKIQLLHTHNAGAHLYGALGARLAGVPLLHTEHTGKTFEAAQSRRANRFAAYFTDYTVAVSTDNAKFICAEEGVNPARLMVLPNGIPLPPVTRPDLAEIRRQLGLPDGCRVIGTVGRLVPVKNYSLLIESFAQLARQQPDLHLLFIGDGPVRAELEAQAHKLNLAPSVHFLGMRSDIAELLRLLDVFVLSSLSEGLSIALLEAMAVGCPIVATAVGGNRELIQDGTTGLLVLSGDGESLANAIARLLQNPPLAHQLGAAARELARSRYSVEAMCGQYEVLFRRLVGG